MTATGSRGRVPSRILVRAPNWAGDVVMATPGFRTLRSHFPDAHVTVQIRNALAPLLAGAPWFDERIDVRSHRGGWRATIREGRSLRTCGYDLGICLPDSVSSALLMRAAGVSEVVGYARGVRRTLLQRPVPPPGGANGSPDGRMVAREGHVLALMAALGAPAEDTRLELFVTAEEQAEARSALAAAGVPEGERFVALAPGASYGSSKCWPPGHFARLADALGSAGLRSVLVGSPAEQPIAARVVSAATSTESPPVDLTGRISLGALKGVLRAAGLLVCNDAGARHVAVAFGTPVVCLFGPTSVAKTNLNLERVTVLTADVACRPCYHRTCPIDHRCMTQIPPEHVLTASQQALASAGGGAQRPESGSA